MRGTNNAVTIALTGQIRIQKNGVHDGEAYYLLLRPPANSLDSRNVLQDGHTLQFDGPGRGPR